MTLAPSPRVPEFPEHPSDGFQIKEDLDNGGYAIWTYNEAFNQWTVEVFNTPLSGYITTRQVLTTPVLVTTADGTEHLLQTQEQVNTTIAAATEAVVKAGGRTTDQVDFLQNSIGKGTWTHVFSGVGYPRQGEFWTDGNTAEFKEITQIILNDTGIPGAEVSNNTGTLQDTRVGDYLIIQERGTNDFGMYVVMDIGIEVVEEEVVRTFGLTLHANRANGTTLVNSSRCQITTSRPQYVIVQDEEPKVSYRGALWYRESDDVLSISNWETGFTGGIGPQWTEVNSNDGGVGGGGGDYDDRYLQLKAPNDVNNQFRIKGTGGTYISTAGDELGIYHLKTPTDVTHAANKGYVDEQIAAIEIPDGELSTREKLYLQGFYPFKIAEGTQVENAGEMTVKKDSYLVDLDPETWKYFSFSVVDAYGLDLAAKSLNHMHMENYYLAQIWFLREDGRKLCSYIAEMKAKDNNFEKKFDLEMKNGMELVIPKSYDVPSLRVDKGEVLWIKCSFWGN